MPRPPRVNLQLSLEPIVLNVLQVCVSVGPEQSAVMVETSRPDHFAVWKSFLRVVHSCSPPMIELLQLLRSQLANL